MEFTVLEGDIAEESADALVNAAGTSLRMGSGVAGALRRKGGEALNDAAVAKGPIDLGEVAVTDAFDLDATYVLHAAAMPHFGDGKATASSIEAATRNALSVADELACHSLVMPILGTGEAGMDFESGAKIVIREIDRFEPRHLSEVSVIAFERSQFELLCRITDSL